jgi:YbbR domain-containing protein
LRFVRFVVRNWPLKISAILLASVLYGAMVVLQTTQLFPGTVAIDVVNKNPESYLLSPDPMPEVSGIHYIAAPEVPISQLTFSATIDLTGAKVSESEYSWVKVQLVANDPRVQIIDYQPQQVRVILDPIVRKTVSVHVVYGTPPAGLQPGTPVPSATSVDVSGAASIVSKVAYAEARVRIDSSGLDVNEDATLVARDASDAIVEKVTFNPRTVHVDIQVGSQIRSESVPVQAVTTGHQAAGFTITSIEVTPPIVAVRGQADALALLEGKALTAPISIAGATSDVSARVSLNLPVGVTSDTTGAITVVIHLQSLPETRDLTIGVVLSGARSDRVYSLSAPSVNVTLGGPRAALNALDTSTFVGTVPVGSYDLGAHTATVSVAVPPGIKVVGPSPQIVVTVSIPPTPGPSPSL